MDSSGLVLVLYPNLDRAEAMRDTLQEAGLEPVLAQNGGQAIGFLKQRKFDLILAGGALEKPNAIEFLAKAREFLPMVLRTYLQDPEVTADWEELINKAEPAALIQLEIDTAHIKKLIARQKKLISSLTPVVSAPAISNSSKELFTLKARVKSLEAENQNLKKENRRKSPFSKGTPAFVPAPSPSVFTPEPSKEAPPEKTEQTPAISQPNKDAVMGDVAPSMSQDLPEADGKMEIDSSQKDVAAEIARVLGLMLNAPDISLPVLPAMAQEIQKITADDNTDFSKIAEVVVNDAAISARILEVANSPLYAGVEQIRSLQNAVSRIGMKETRSLLLAVTSEGLFKTKNKLLASYLDTLWMHSLAVAYSNEIIAKQLFIAESDDFFMMGLLHDIGKLLIIHLLEEGIKKKLWDNNLLQKELIEEIFSKYHIAIGQKLMEKWEYPKAFHEVVGLHNDDANVFEYEEYVVVTYYSNLLTRKLGFSLVEHVENIYNNKQIAQALNMDDKIRGDIEKIVQETVTQIRESFN